MKMLQTDSVTLKLSKNTGLPMARPTYNGFLASKFKK